MVVVAAPLRHDPEEHHAAGHPLQHVREIFGSHERRRHRDVVIGADQLGRDAPREIDKARIVTVTG